MQVYIINGKENSEKTEFSAILAKKLSEKSKTLLVGTKRNKDKNIEDIFNKDGMITYDICDYFLEYTSLEKIINKENENLDFIISPFLEDKYEIKNEDILKLLENLQYENFIFDGLDQSLIEDKISLDLIGQDEISKNLSSTYYLIVGADDDFDHRLFKEELLNKSSKYLGYVNKNGSYNNILDNIINQRVQNIENIGFFEKIKMKFRK